MEVMNETEIKVQHKLQQFKTELQEELMQVLDYWMKYTVDEKQGGFYGSVNNRNEPDTTAAKGIVMVSRICWSFSAAYGFNKQRSYFSTAERAFNFIVDHFIDREFGGVYWSVDATGNMLEGKKQIYGLAFCIYGLTEFYKISRNPTALNIAIDLYHFIEEKSFDKVNNGYAEAFGRDWQEMADLRLSEKDNNDRKTANTHLHIVEAYANLYTVWPNEKLKERIANLLHLFQQHFINKNHHHLNLFFDDSWNLRSTLQSYGHDIEAAWLLQQCAEVIKDPVLIAQFKSLAVPVTNAATEGLDKDGGLWYEYEPANKFLIEEKHSWPQAEAMIGFFNAGQLTGGQHYFNQSIQSWEFIKRYIKDQSNGEWLWGVHKDYLPMQKEKAGFWKCPYHSSRALLEVMNRIDQLNETKHEA
jgi:cellobiose epimerase